ncbi:MAG: SDR family NAD(P)-dependent oxidoreductase, partial [Desulfobacteraceae bacterium]|nr:SDR family NAD(P)-dependent oxidoreductase [Desulfobacteraceae bacterium]
PQHRLFLQEAWHAIEDAAYTSRELSGKKCGVFVGYNFVDYPHLLQQSNAPVDAFAFTGNSEAILPARISYVMNLKGPSVAINTACSSSLVAIHYACESLRNGESELALAGGVQVITTAHFHLLAGSVGILSPKGRSRVFDDRADGIVPGEGVGVVMLKPLDAAVRDGDHVYGVIIGSGVNQDGKTNGITAPSASSQTELECEVLERFGIDPETIGYVEAHGTGTSLGDPIEIQALTDAFRKYTGKRQFCAVGSVKSNIGHTLGAAGVASFLKALCCLGAKQWVPSLHFETPNRHIDLDTSPFFVNTALADWPEPPNSPRRAAVSSFAISGTNAHVILEEFREAHFDRSNSDSPAEPQLIVLSAKNEDRLKAYAGRMAEFFRIENRKSTIENIAYTLQVGREAMAERLAFVAADRTDLKAKLGRYHAGEGAQEDGVCRGHAGAASAASDPLIEGQEGRAFVESLVRARKLEKLGRLWVSGADLDWRLLHPGRRPQRVSLPAYPFAKERCWAVPEIGGETPDDHPAVITLRHVWEPADNKGTEREEAIDGPLLLLDHAEDRFRAVREGWRSDVVRVGCGDRFLRRDENRFEVDPGSPQDYERLFHVLNAENRSPRNIVLLWTLEKSIQAGESATVSPPSGRGLEPQMARGVFAAFHLVRCLYGHPSRSVRRILALFRSDPERPEPHWEALSGYSESIRSVLPDLRFQTVQTDRTDDARRIAEILLRELRVPAGERRTAEVRYAGGRRLLRSLKPVDFPEDGPPPFRNEGVYLVTGGAGGLGRVFARHLARQYRARLVLAGRSPLDPEKTELLESLRKQGGEAVYIRADAAKLGDATAVVKEAGKTFGPLNGVIHAAGVPGEKPVFQKDAAEFGATLAPKIQGALNLDAATRREPLDFFVLFSSTSVFLGDFGRCDYAVGNRFMDGFALKRETLRQQARRHGRTVSINWPLWREGGMHLSPEGEEFYLKSAGMSYLETSEGLALFERILRNPPCQVAVLKGSPARIERLLNPAPAPGRAAAQPKSGFPPAPPASEKTLIQRIESDLKQLISGILKMPVQNLHAHVNLGDFGLDSISLKAFAERIGETYGIEILPSLFFSKPTMEHLGQFLLEEHGEAVKRHYGDAPRREPDERVSVDPTPHPAVPSIVEAPRHRRPRADRGSSGDIAVIGLAGRFPGSKDPAEFWRHLM